MSLIRKFIMTCFIVFLVFCFFKGATSYQDVIDVVKSISENIISILPDEHPVNDLEDEVRFFLFTRNSSSGKRLIDNYLIDRTKPVRFLIHGWIANREVYWYTNVTQHLLLQKDVSVIQVDWRHSAGSVYPLAIQNSKIVGRKVGNFIMNLSKTQGIPLSQIHITGHSLGSHVAGFAGKTVIDLMSSKIRSITSLDAAGPLYSIPEVVLPHERLSEDDAEIVENLHTDGGILGYKYPIGTIDYYANGGITQPSCNFFKPLRMDSFLPNCNHRRSVEYYIRALRDGGIPAYKCDSWESFNNGSCYKNLVIRFGNDVSEKVKGIFYFKE